MDYKKLIVGTVDRIHEPELLHLIYIFVKRLAEASERKEQD